MPAGASAAQSGHLPSAGDVRQSPGRLNLDLGRVPAVAASR